MMDLPSLAGLSVYPHSLVTVGQTRLFLAREDDSGAKHVGVLAAPTDPVFDAFQGATGEYDGQVLLLGPASAANATALRDTLDWLRPQSLGLATSAGCGDRLGLATPGHARAMAEAPGVAPIFAQQSMRENARTGRTPQQVVDDATWGVFQVGWREGFGADADHLKTTGDADVTAAAGHSLFTIDPGDHVDDEAHTASLPVLRRKFAALPWDDLESSPDGLAALYLDKIFDQEGLELAFDEETLLRAAGKYGRATAHTARMYRHLEHTIVDRPWELEVSVDETATPTSHLEHLFLASELRRLGVRWVSLAPRYVGEFEKGVDYIGDLEVFRASFAGHAAIARTLGPYKLSLHSGSDKFSIYPIAMQETRGMVHLKTAGTSYLEGLRAIARVQPDLFRAVYELAFLRYGEDRASYHVSARPSRAPRPEGLQDEDMPAVLDQFDAREMLHVTFGSALARYGDEIKAALSAHEEAYYAALEAHFQRHLAPFAR